jgi:hypothetical protein
MKPISQLINPELSSKTLALGHIDKLFKTALPIAAHSHIRVANIIDKEVTVFTDSPAWSTRLRLYTQEMLFMLAQHTDYGITNIRIRLSKNHQSSKSMETTKPVLSRASADLIRQTASTITDIDLKNALLLLAQRNKR